MSSPRTFLLPLGLLGGQVDADGIDQRAMQVDLAGLVEELERRHVLGRVRFAGEHVLNGFLIVGDADGDFLELGIERRPVGRHLRTQGGARCLAGLDPHLTT